LPTIEQRLKAAFDLQRAGRLDEAESLHRGILQESPDNAQALFYLGLLVHQMGRHPEAIDLLSRCLAVHGPDPVVHSNLAAICLAAGLHDDALAHARQAVQLNPILPSAHHNLGAALSARGQFDEAINAFREAIHLDPRHVEAHCDLAGLLHRLDRLADALRPARQAIRLAPNLPRAHFLLGSILLSAGDRTAATQHLREAIRLKPDFVEARHNLARALRDPSQLAEAEQLFRQVLHQGATPRAHTSLASTLVAQGRIDEALTHLQDALRLDPDHVPAITVLGNLVAAGHSRLAPEQVAHIEELAGRETLPPTDRHNLHFALGAIFDRLEDYAKAFTYYHRGNELRKDYERSRGLVFKYDLCRRITDRLIDVYTPAYFERVRGFGLDTERPVFVVGMLRSGTTLVEQILASHPAVHGAGELPHLGTMVTTVARRLDTPEKYPECMRSIGAAAVRVLAQEYDQALVQASGGRHPPEVLRVIDKLPANYLNLGLIATLFPRAHIIHCRRDPVDTCLSCYFQNFQDAIPYTLDLRHVGQYYREYERLMAHWAAVLPIPIFDLSYEELTSDQEATTRRLVAFCGLEWDDRCLRFHETSRAVQTASLLQVRQPMYRRSVGRWKRYEAHLGPLLEELGGFVQRG
jgi:tetratricopeptide (TPR) repeat protein